MIKYKSLDVFLTKRGKVFIVLNDKDRNDEDFIGLDVIIDDNKYCVKGIESWLVSKERLVGEKIAILI